MFESLAMLRISLKRFAQQDKFGLKMWDESGSDGHSYTFMTSASLCLR
jgi:hypothetical protein